MKIQPVKSENVACAPKAKKTAATDGSAVEPEGATARREVTDPQAARKTKLLALLHQEPEVRPHALQRAKDLLADPAYPSVDTLTKLAQKLVTSTQPEA